MGFFGKIFGGGGPRRPPAWAKAFGDDGARFDAWCAMVVAVLEGDGFLVAPGDVRSGSLMIDEDGGKRREWHLHETAEACAAVPEAEWRAIVQDSFAHGGEVEAAPAPAAERGGAKRAWIIGTAAWGGVMFECGAKEMLLIVLPITDRAPLATLPVFPRGLIRAIIVCNAGDDGHLDASAVAKACGLDVVYAIDPDKPVDRGGAPGRVKVKPFEVLELGPLRVWRANACVHGTWAGGITFLAGDAVPFSLIGRHRPNQIVGKLVIDNPNPPGIDAATRACERVLIVGNVPGIKPRRLAEALSLCGFRSELVNAPPVDLEAEPRRKRVIAYLLAGEIDRADALATEAIDAGEDVADLRYQRAMIALMRGDEDAALAQLAQVDTPQARSSRAGLLARRGDREALALAARVLGELPGDAIAIRSAIFTHLLLDDRDGARAALAAHGAHLDALVRAALAQMIDDPSPPVRGGHRFPELAQLAVDVTKGMIDGKDFATAEPILRRAAAWDPENHGLVAELGFCLSQQGRDDEAIAIYDAAIARGGYSEILRFNRGNCMLRASRTAEAADDFAACLALKSDWHEARVNLCSARFASGDHAGARQALDELRTKGGSPAHVAALEKMLAGTL